MDKNKFIHRLNCHLNEFNNYLSGSKNQRNYEKKHRFQF